MAATAQTINFATAASLQSPIVARKLTQNAKNDADKIVDIGTNAGSKNKKAMLTTSSPRMNSAPPASPTATQGVSELQLSEKIASALGNGITFLSLLAAYMDSMNAAQIALSSTQTSINSAQFTMSEGFVDLAQDQVSTAQKAYKQYQQELYEQQHQSFWSKFCGFFVMGLSVLLAGLTGGLTAFMGAALMTTLMETGALQKLDTAVLGSNAPSWETDLFNVGVAIVGTICACALTGAATAAISSAVSSGAKTAVSAAADAAVQDGVNSEVNQIAQEIVEQDSAAAQSAAKGFISKAYDAGFSSTSVIMNATQFFSALNPLGDLITQALKKAGVSEEVADIVGQIAGMVITIGAGFAAGYLTYNAASEGDLEDPVLKLLTSKLGAGKLVAAQIGTGVVNYGFSAASGAFQILAGKALEKVAGAQKDAGLAQAAITFYQSLLDILSPIIQAENKSFSNLMSVYTQMSSNYDAFVAPGALAAEIL